MFDWVKEDLRDFGKYTESSQNISENSHSDISFIGSGLSSTYTLIELIKQLDNRAYTDKQKHDNLPLKIHVFEKDKWFWGGIPYGRRSGFTSLIITPLDEFLPENELEPFIEWVSKNFSWLIIPFKENAGLRSKAWIRESEEQLTSGNIHGLHIPRYFFGIYLWDKLRDTVENSSIEIGLNFIRGEVKSISKIEDLKKGGKFEVTLKDRITFLTNHVMLGIGMPNIRLLADENIKFDDAILVGDPYNPDLDSTMRTIFNFINSIKEPEILIVGANASALELIYQITNDTNKKNVKLTVLSPQGKLPDLFIKNKKTDFVALKLRALSELDLDISADSILEALRFDLETANDGGYKISDTLPVFTKYVGKLVNQLNRDEKSKFVTYHGVEIGRLQRRAGAEYTAPIDDLRINESLEVIEGRFIKMTTEKAMGTIVEYQNANGGNLAKHHYDVVINCSGSAGLVGEGLSELLNQLKDSGICVPTTSKHGFKVGNKFDVCDGFYINGPLLAGNVVGDMGIWHVEHCGRIISFAKQIANNLKMDLIDNIES